MTSTNGILDRIGIASPCSASWEAMQGDERRRFCGDCKLHVHDLSGMSRAEAEELLRASGGRLCVRLFRRRDGTVLTRDCPVGLRRRARLAWARCAALVGALFAALPGCAPRAASPAPGAGTPPAGVELMGEVYVPEPEPLMGKVCVDPQDADPAAGPVK